MKFHLLTFLSLFTFLSHAQNQPNLVAPDLVTVYSYWEEGDSRTYTREEVVEDYRKGKDKPHSVQEKRDQFQLKVLKAKDSTYLMRMDYTVNDLGEEHLDRVLGAILHDLEIQYEISEYGELGEVQNLDELSGSARGSIAAYYAKIDTKDVEGFQVYDSILTEWTKPENIEMLFIEDLIAVHQWYGLNLRMGEPQEYEGEYPTLDGYYIPGNGSVSLVSIQSSADKCLFRDEMSPQKEDMQSYMEHVVDYFRDLGLEELRPDDLKMRSSSKGTYTMQLSTGWMRKVKVKNTISFTIDDESAKKVKTITFSEN